MRDTLVFATVLLPFFAAVLAFLARGDAPRKLIMIGTAAALILASACLLGQGPFTHDVSPVFEGLVVLGDFALLCIILVVGWRLRNQVVIWLTLAQIAGLAFLDFFLTGHASPGPAFYVDDLSLVMVAIVSMVGSLIGIYALGYMREHEDHPHLAKSRQPRFFFFLILFLGAMNGLVLSNSLSWMYFFWEITTFCSFILIGHDGTPVARKNAERALWMNVIGGAAFVLGLILLQKAAGTLSLQALLAKAPEISTGGILLAPLFLLVFAGFTKAAQPPFQSWLTGAMVAPTPVSALLHSSTMVKAGVYLIIRLAPLFAGTYLSALVALFGGFCFLATAAMAVGQSNGKKILAYSTISNLALIIACAGINTPAAITAAILLIIFHAVSKALLFLCVGTIEQTIGSRDIEDMRGLFRIMPHTAVITAVGVMTMMLPPFGMLLAKWMAIESAHSQFLVAAMLALGSALTVLFWARWAGMLFSAPFGPATPEIKPASVRLPLIVLAFAAVLLSLAAPLLNSALARPMTALYAATGAYAGSLGGLENQVGLFPIYPLFLILGVGFVLALRAARRVGPAQATAPYMCGAGCDVDGRPGFTGPMNQPVAALTGNSYLPRIFGEDMLGRWANVVALVLVALMLGGVLW
ncbi:NADH-quinone oxidoreductase subunit 5 family protein [Desulfolutivibrio sulfoxidireducens]|uniref:NADH-quinone oxidoreductase subunit 5 family protein n=1 Tax=Desulfolutivibrio sulfoxidireducens TaxID=2773299 RepID=UPI00159E5C94|nr:NADH-quinone oxidoreductase subunit L [Desulfolutivibrio sulfoxidireducens]QLA14894.1 NADH-quinone oxidoreductase subunit L [Desulfolutivibrio sulfoxidireducens]